MVYLYYIIGALLESIKSPCVSRTFSLKDLLLTGFRGVFRRLLGYHAPVLDETAHKMRKCDACFDRLQRGLQPICVESCPNRAIEFGEIEELRKKHGKLAEVAPLPSASKTQPNLVLVVPAQARPAGDTSGTEY